MSLDSPLSLPPQPTVKALVKTPPILDYVFKLILHVYLKIIIPTFILKKGILYIY